MSISGIASFKKKVVDHILKKFQTRGLDPNFFLKLLFLSCFMLHLSSPVSWKTLISNCRGWNWALYGHFLQHLRILFQCQPPLLLKERLWKGLNPSLGWRTIQRNYLVPRAMDLIVGHFLARHILGSEIKFHRSVINA